MRDRPPETLSRQKVSVFPRITVGASDHSRKMATIPSRLIARKYQSL